MSSFIYDTTHVSVRTDQGVGSSFDPLRCDATKNYMTHYQNELVLTHFQNHGTIAEKAQATREMEICKRKQKYWARQSHFDHERMIREKALLHKKMAT